MNLHGIRWKLMLPYAGLTLVFAVGAGYGFTKMLTASLQDRLNSQLVEAAGVTSDSAVRDERQHLTTIRGIGFTDGVALAVAEGDGGLLSDLVRPVIVNAKVDRVEIINTAGRRLFGTQLEDPKSLRYESLADQPSYRDWSFLSDILGGRRDELGDKWSQVVSTDSGLILYTGGPIVDSAGRVVGAVLVGSKFESLLPASKASSQADTTIYDLNGRPLVSTFPVTTDEDRSALTPPLNGIGAEALREPVLERKLVAGRGYQFLFADMRVRNQIIARFAVALPSAPLASAADQARWQMSIGFGLLAGAVLFTGWALARGVTKPLRRLVRTALAVAGGDLTARTELHGKDEIGTVATTFDAMTERLQRQHVATIGALASAIDARDPYTAGHSVRVGELSAELGRELGLPSSSLYQLRIGGILHDVGKIGVRDKVLLKPGALTAPQRRLIQEHPRIGLTILADADLPPEVLAIVGSHHERLNGKGYPLGLTADELSIFPRVAAVADVYDALTTDRPYRAGMAAGEALFLLRKEAMEGLIDPDVVAAMTRISGFWNDYVHTAEGDTVRLRELLRQDAA